MRTRNEPTTARLLDEAAGKIERLEEELLLGRAEAVAAVDLAIRKLAELNRQRQLKPVRVIIEGYVTARDELIALDPQALPSSQELNFLATRLRLLELCAAHLTEHASAAGLDSTESRVEPAASGSRRRAPDSHADQRPLGDPDPDIPVSDLGARMAGA